MPSTSLRTRVHPCAFFAIFGVWVLFAVTTTATLAARPDAPSDPALDKALQTLAVLEPGQDLNLLAPIELAVIRAQADEQVRGEIESRLLTILQSGVTDLGSDYVCRQLSRVGSDAAIPVLAELLRDPRRSYMARYALEDIGGAAATAALREQLGQTSGDPQVGIVISLGRIADDESVSQLLGLLDLQDPALCKAAIVALGRIGSAEAVDALAEFSSQVPASMQTVLIDARLAAGESLCGRGDHAKAAEVYESLQSHPSQQVRAAAFRGLIAAKPGDSLDLILTGLAAEESWQRAVAADCARDLRNPEDIGRLAEAVPSLPVSGQLAAWDSLGRQQHPLVREAAWKAVDSPHGEVRVAGLQALVASGTADDVPRLADLAATADDPQVREAAGQTLSLMPAAGTDPAILRLIETQADVSPLVVRCALARRSPELVPAFLQAAESSRRETRLEAWKALEVMATPDHVAALVDLLIKTPDGEEREAAGRAVWMSCQQIDDPSRRTSPLLEALERADTAGRRALLPTLARLGGEGALAAVRAAMDSDAPELRDAGYRAICNWPDATVADQLLEIATGSAVGQYRIWALRAYVRVVSLPDQRPDEQTFEMLQPALPLATRIEDKRLLVTRLGAVRTPEALDLLLSFLDDPQLRETAVPAVFTLAKGLSQSHPDQAREALERIRPLTSDESLLQQIPKVLRDIEARKRGG